MAALASSSSLIVFLNILIFVPDGGNALRVWKKEEISLKLKSEIKEKESKLISLTIFNNLSSMAIVSRNLEVYTNLFPSPRDPSLIPLGYSSSLVTVVVLKTNPAIKIMAVKSFFTGQPTEGHNLVTFLSSLQPNRLVIFIGRPNFIGLLSLEENGYLANLGSAFISVVRDTDSWIMALLTSSIGATDRKHLRRSSYDFQHRWKRGISSDFRTTVTPVSDYLHKIESMMQGRLQQTSSHWVLGEVMWISKGKQMDFGPSSLDIYVPMLDVEIDCPLYTSPNHNEQAEFCRTYEGYGQLCSCQDTYFPRQEPNSISIPMREKIPVVIVTANKPQYLYRMLRNLDVVRGSSETEKLIVVDGFREETLALSKLFGIDVRVHKPQGNPGDNTRTNMNIGFSLWAAFDHFPEVKKTILLEDDLILSPDLLSFFHQTSVLLDRDETISHVSSFGQNSFPQTAADPHTLLRVEMYPQYGWMTTRRWAEHAFRYWVREGKNIDWDWWLFNEGPKMGLEAIVPEVSRTGHIGSSGAHTTGYDQFRLFQTRVMSGGWNHEPENFHLERMASNQSYDAWMDEEIKNAMKIKLTVHPCVEEFIPQNETGPFVLYLGLASREDTQESFLLMQLCLGIDGTDLKELYNGVLRLNILPFGSGESTGSASAFDRKIVYLVGCPLSKYCKHSIKMKDWTIPSENIVQIAMDISHRRRFQKLTDMHRLMENRRKNLFKSLLL